MPTITAGVENLSPLDRVRLVEAEVARQLIAGREAAEERISKACSQAEQLKSEASEAGRKAGEAQYKNILTTAEEEAKAIVAQAQQRASERKQRSQQHMEQIIAVAIRVVTGQEGEARSDEH